MRPLRNLLRNAFLTLAIALPRAALADFNCEGNFSLFGPSGAVADSRWVGLMIAADAEAALQDLMYYPIKGEGPDEFKWGFDGPVDAREEYERDLRYAIRAAGETPGPHFFEAQLERAREDYRSTHVLDLFGSGFFVENQMLADTITGLRFGRYDRKKLPASYPASKVPTEVLGDILNSDTWAKLDRSMMERDISGFELVTMRPIAGWQWKSIPEVDYLALKLIVGNVLARLSPTGKFYFQTQTHMKTNSPILDELIRTIENSSTHRLILRPREPDSGTIRLEGALVPK